MSTPGLPAHAEKLARAVPKFRCPECREWGSKVVRPMAGTETDGDGVVARIRECLWCRARFRTEERMVERRQRKRNKRDM